MKLSFAAKTDVGKKRAQNQDSYLSNMEHGIFVVADGMGGHQGGEIASSLAVEVIEKEMSSQAAKNSDPLQFLNQTMLKANSHIYKHGIEVGLNGMGTTVTSAWVIDEMMYIGHVGDSRLYLYRDDSLFQITEDHSQVYELLRAGLITEENMHSVQKNVITRSIGFEPQVIVDVFCRPIKKGDRYLICSDGLSGMLSSKEIAQVLKNHEISTAVKNLIDLANLRGGDDNITVLIIEST